MSHFQPGSFSKIGLQRLSSVVVGSGNLLNLALPGHQFYPNQDPWSTRDYERKLDRLGGMLRRINTDIQGFQEVWDEPSLKPPASPWASGRPARSPYTPSCSRMKNNTGNMA